MFCRALGETSVENYDQILKRIEAEIKTKAIL